MLPSLTVLIFSVQALSVPIAGVIYTAFSFTVFSEFCFQLRYFQFQFTRIKE